MIFRCSVCKGQFELEPDRKKPMVFCAHCGAALKTGKPGSVKSASMTAAEKALMGDGAGEAAADSGASPLEQLTGARSQPQGYVEMFEAAEGTDESPAPAGDDPLAALTGGGPSPKQSRPTIRRIRKKEDNTALIMTISVLALVALFIVIGVVVWVFSQGEPPKPKPKENNVQAPAFFGKWDKESTAYPENADKPKKEAPEPE